MTNDQWHDHIHRLDQEPHMRLTRLLWTWALGTVWLTALIAGAVVLRLWGA